MPEDLPRRSPRRALALSITALAGAVIGGTALVDTLWPAPRPQLLGLERQADETERAQARLLDGSLAALAEHDLALTSRVRATVLPSYSEALLELLREGGEHLAVGPEGWVFLRGRDGPTVVHAEEWVGPAAAKLAALRQRLHENGVRLLVAPVPRKSVACPSQLPAGFDAHPELEDMFREALARLGVPAVDLLAAMRALPEEQRFHKYGSHWTDRCQELAAEAIAESLGERLDPAERTTRIQVLPNQLQDADLLEYVGLAPDAARAFAAPERFERLRVLGPTGEPISAVLPPEPGRLAIAGTSFTALRVLPALLMHATGITVVNAAQPGGEPVDTLRDLLFDGAQDPLPADVVLEIPLHILFRAGTFPAAGEIFTRLPAAGGVPVLPEDACIILPPFAAGAGEVGPDGMMLLRLPPRLLSHTGDGAASLRLRGHAPEGVLLQLRSGAGAPSYEWRPRQTELVLPLLSGWPTADGATLVVRAPGTQAVPLEVTEAAIVVTGKDPATLQLNAGPVVAAAGGWKVQLRPRLSVPLPDLSTLWIESRAALAPGGKLTVTIEFNDGEPLRLKLAGVDPGGAVLAGLSAARGRTLRVLTLSAAGTPPPADAVAARILMPEVK